MTKYFYNCKSIFMGKSLSKNLISINVIDLNDCKEKEIKREEIAVTIKPL